MRRFVLLSPLALFALAACAGSSSYGGYAAEPGAPYAQPPDVQTLSPSSGATTHSGGAGPGSTPTNPAAAPAAGGS